MISELLWARSLGTAFLVLCSGLIQRLKCGALVHLGALRLLAELICVLRIELKPISLLAVSEGRS